MSKLNGHCVMVLGGFLVVQGAEQVRPRLYCPNRFGLAVATFLEGLAGFPASRCGRHATHQHSLHTVVARQNLDMASCWIGGSSVANPDARLGDSEKSQQLGVSRFAFARGEATNSIANKR